MKIPANVVVLNYTFVQNSVQKLQNYLHSLLHNKAMPHCGSSEMYNYQYNGPFSKAMTSVDTGLSITLLKELYLSVLSDDARAEKLSIIQK